MINSNTQGTEDSTKKKKKTSNINIEKENNQTYQVKTKSKQYTPKLLPKEKEEKLTNKSRFELRKVFELRAKIDGIVKNKHKLFAIFNNRNEVEKGYSAIELAAALKPYHLDKNGVPTKEGVNKTKAIIRARRKQIIEEYRKGGIASNVIVPFACKTSDGWLYYDMNDVEAFRVVEDQVDKVIAGLEKLVKTFKKLVNLPQMKKDAINEEMLLEIQRMQSTLRRLKGAKK